MPTRRFISFLPFTLPLLALSACDPSEAAQEPDLDEETLEAAPTLALPHALTVPPALTRAGVAPFGPQAVAADPPAPTPTPGPTPPRPTEGDHVLVRGPGGAAWMPYHLVGDDVMIGDDVILGTVEKVFGVAPDSDTPVARSLAESSLGKRWPDGVVPYEIDVGVDIPNAAVITDTLARLEATLPVRFVADDSAVNRVRFVLWNQTFGLSEGIGMAGDVQQIKLPQSVNARTVAHEVLHALGRFHEQQRPDRDDFVDYHAECVNPGSEGNFSKLVGELPLGPYDLDSLMHYRGTSQCAKDENNVCICNTLEYAGTNNPVVSPTSGCDESADPVCFFSDLDIGAMWTMYGDFVADAVQTNDYLGWATAAGDFDGDGLDDIAIGSPGQDVGAAPNAGQVIVALGGAGGIDRAASRQVRAGVGGVTGRSERDDIFGTSLAVGDVDGVAPADLVVGVPGEDAAATNDGAVALILGSPLGLTGTGSRQYWSGSNGSAGVARDGDLLGAAVALGDVDADGEVEVLAGAPGKDVGAVREAGAVLVIGTVDGVLTSDSPNVAGTAETDDRFGRSVATGDVNGDSLADLVVAAPTETESGLAAAGALTVVRGHADGGLTGAGSAHLVRGVGGLAGAARADDHFGGLLPPYLF